MDTPIYTASMKCVREDGFQPQWFIEIRDEDKQLMESYSVGNHKPKKAHFSIALNRYMAEYHGAIV